MKRERTSKILNTIWVTACAVIFLLPLLWMLSSSLKTGPEVFAKDFTWLPKVFQWENYVRVWTDSKVPFWKLYLNSLTVSVVGTLGQLLLSSLAGYALAKLRFRGKNFVFLLMMVTMMIPGQATIIPRYMMFFSVGLYDTLWALILPSFFSISSIFLLRQFYLGLPNEMMEAALIDGAGYFRIWRSIMLPLTKNGLISAAILAFISSWNEYLSALIFLPSKENYTVSLAIRYYLNDTAREYNLMMCAAASTIIPVVILYISAQKYFEDGIASSSVKG